ncbi:TIGR03564 family F420-dependent LLM class oxidoreductase [Mycolicibacterium arenosum]|uniref:TIGR03564 family F420-dependent LLM class oxidoreductase n=1 Tax=Mycolicibacterium arenosum TaxID=2952157 RepID=A0ABT1LY90_9MYCO|nr:TIGR03564 family F420-dependent LLM class oxidoreductase [Mycolicibacterium sp. CAU 1645]MCP9271864.1 TIGR03564 family F420-dependent LLM class oxidoreductase [Mycolicibacterium sp. CAU 1645]
MRFGLTGGAGTVDKIVAQAQRAEADGFSALWYASNVAGDPLTAMALAGRATSRIELGTAVLQTYPCHPLLQANRVAAAANAMNRPGLTLGLGPSHRPLVEGVLGLDYDHPGRNTEEYLRIVTALLDGQRVDVDGEDWTTHSDGRMATLDHPVPVLLSALSPRLLRVAGELAAGTVLWMATAEAIDRHVAPTLTAAAEAAGRPAPRIVAGLPIVVHDDAAQAREAIAATSGAYAGMPNYRRILDRGGVSDPAEAAIVGTEREVTQQLNRLIDAGATDVWAQLTPVGPDRRTSLIRARDLLRSLSSAS